MTTVEDLVVGGQIAAVAEIASAHGWAFERAEPARFRVSLSAGNGDTYQLEVDFAGFPVKPAAFHWRNADTGELDGQADSPAPYSRAPNFFFPTGEICAPWNRLASEPGGPHTRWDQSSWQEQEETGSTVTLPAMVLRIHHELLSDRYSGRRQC